LGVNGMLISMWSSGGVGLLTPHGIAAEFDAMGVVNEAIQNGIGVGRIPDQIEPACHGELAGHHGGAATVAVLEDLEQMVAGVAVERFKAPIIQDQQIDPRERLHACGDAPVAFGKGEIGDQARQAGVKNRAVVTAGLVADGAGQPTFAHPCWPDDRAVFVGGDPVAPEQQLEQPATSPRAAR